MIVTAGSLTKYFLSEQVNFCNNKSIYVDSDSKTEESNNYHASKGDDYEDGLVMENNIEYTGKLWKYLNDHEYELRYYKISIGSCCCYINQSFK